MLIYKRLTADVTIYWRIHVYKQDGYLPEKEH